MTGPLSGTDGYDAALRAHRIGERAAAEKGYRACLAGDPDHADAAHMLGVLLLQTGRAAEARPWLDTAVAATPVRDDRLSDAGTAAAATGDTAVARRHFETALALRPKHARHHYNLARLDEMTGRTGAALTGYRKAVALWPAFAEARLNALLIEAAGPRSTDPAAHREIADLLIRFGRYGDAAVRLRRGLNQAPVDPDMTAALARTYFAMGHAKLAVPLFRQAVAQRPNDAVLHSALIFALYFDASSDAIAIEREHRIWGDRQAPTIDPIRAGASAIAPGTVCVPTHTACHGFGLKAQPDRPVYRPVGRWRRSGPPADLRIGFVGCDFKDHSNAWMFSPLFDPPPDGKGDGTRLYLYGDVANPDTVTDRFRDGPGTWRDVRGLDDDALAARIADDRIDVLIDLIGHTTRNRLGAFARRPAPIQAAWVNPTGVPAVDWLLTDAVLRPLETDPPDIDRERPWRLPLGAMPFAPPGMPTAAVDALGSGPMTRGEGPVFGCFNNLAKLSAPLLDAWAEILAALPAARLMLKYPSLDDAGLRDDIRARLARRAVTSDRVLLHGRTGRDRHLVAYREIDVALDTFPGNGGVTSWEALWMGVPLVCLRGDRPNGRASAAILTSVGRGDMVAPDVAGYVATAVDLVRTGALPDRRLSRANLVAAPIFQPGAYAYSVRTACRTMRDGGHSDAGSGASRLS